MSVHLTGPKVGILISSVGVFGSAFLWLLSFKVIAYWMGPEGIGLFSQLRQMAQAATLSATFGGTNTVVQGLAERQEELERSQFRATAFRIIGISGVSVVLAMGLAANQLTQLFLLSELPSLVLTVRLIALAVLLNVGGTYAIAVLNGYRSYPYLALSQIAGPAALVALLAAAWWWRLSPDPQLLGKSFVLCFGVTCLVGALGVTRLPKFASALPATGALSKAKSRAFLWFALSHLVATLSSTLTLLLIRSWLIEAKGLASAGLFDAGWTLTFNYTTLFLTACNAVYLPQLTAARSVESQKACMLKAAYLVLGASLLICHTMVLFKGPLINLLYSPKFEASGQVLGVLVIAVLFRGVSWVYGTMLLATRNSRMLLASDLSLNLLLLATSRYALNNFSSLEALSWAFVLPNFVYLVFAVEYACMKNRIMLRRQIWPYLLAGILPLLYLALSPPWPQSVWSDVASWLCMGIAIIVSGVAMLAFRRVVL